MTDRDDRARLGDSENLTGTHRSRIAAWFGIVLLIATLAALIWFGASNTETSEPGPAPMAAPSPGGQG